MTSTAIREDLKQKRELHNKLIDFILEIDEVIAENALDLKEGEYIL